MSIETLYDNEWLSLKKVVDPERGVNGYIFSHESRCKGIIVAVLPFRKTAQGYEFLAVCETTPCWGMDPVRSALTGGWEGDNPLLDAQRELEEEAGYKAQTHEFISLGESYASKSSDTRYKLYAVDLTGKTAGAPTGDGSQLEAEATRAWYTADELADVKDPQVHVMLNRLRTYWLR